MRLRAVGYCVGLWSALFAVNACSSDSGTALGAGAPSATGGQSASGGASAGGSVASGAASPSGGATANGGTSAKGGATATGGANTASGGGGSVLPSGQSPMIGGCAILPSNHIFNTPIDSFPVHPSSSDFMSAVGKHNIHLDLGTSIDQKADDYYGIPYNVVHSKTIPWLNAAYTTMDTADFDWDPTTESDCAISDAHTLTSPCVGSAATKSVFPIPAAPLVEGGIVTDPSQPYGDHHLLLLDADTCALWELYHAYPDPKSGWDIFGSAFFDLRSNKLRPADWTSADAAGFPILPLLLRADEASSGTILHALRFTIQSSHIRQEYTWPARHLTGNNTAASAPPMGQAFRIKASFAIPASFNMQSRAIAQALKTYGAYIADGGSALYIQGEPSPNWQDDTFSQVQSISSDEFEAVDLSSISKRSGFDPNSGAVP